MRYVTLLWIVVILSSCNFSSSPKGDGHTLNLGDTVVDLNEVRQMSISNASDYRDLLDQLDQGDTKSIDVAVELFGKSKADTISRDSMFVAFSDFLDNVAANYVEDNAEVGALLDHSPSKQILDKIHTNLLMFGLGIHQSGDSFSLEPQKAYLLRNFGPGLSAAYRQCLAIQAMEQKIPFQENGKLLIPIDSLTSRIVMWEDFINKYPTFISIKVAQDRFTQYLNVYLAGTDQSRIFDDETNRLNDRSLKSFELFVQNYPDRKSTELVKDYLDLLRSSNFNYTDNVDAFLISRLYH